MKKVHNKLFGQSEPDFLLYNTQRPASWISLRHQEAPAKYSKLIEVTFTSKLSDFRGTTQLLQQRSKTGLDRDIYLSLKADAESHTALQLVPNIDSKMHSNFFRTSSLIEPATSESDMSGEQLSEMLKSATDDLVHMLVLYNQSLNFLIGSDCYTYFNNKIMP